jgi:hypothetical protein
MNHEILRKKLDDFFAKVKPDELVQKFEKLGYEFLDADLYWGIPKSGVAIKSVSVIQKSKFLDKLLNRERKNILSQNMTSEYSGSFFCIKLAVW